MPAARGGFPTAGSYADLGYQSTWDVSRAQSGAAGIIVNYTGGDVAGAFQPSSPIHAPIPIPRWRRTRARSCVSSRPCFRASRLEWNGRATLSAPVLDPNLRCSYSFWKVGQYTAFGGYEGVPQGSIHFSGEHTSQDFQGFMEGGASEGMRAAHEVIHALAGNG